jgi:hypothetical protein
MDPNEAFRRWKNAVDRDDMDEASEAWRDLNRWLRRGGFPPDWSPRQHADFRNWHPNLPRRKRTTLTRENPPSSTTESVLIAVGIVGAVALGYSLLTSKSASAATGGAAPAQSPELYQLQPGNENAAITLILGNGILDALPGVVAIQPLNPPASGDITYTASPDGIVSLSEEAGLSNGYLITAQALGTTTITGSDESVVNVTVVSGASSQPVNINYGVSGSTIHVGVGQLLQFNLPAPTSGYNWTYSESGNVTLSNQSLVSSSSGYGMTANASSQPGTETVTFQQTNGTIDPAIATYTFTIVTS